jgi:hypothetical protein
MDEVARAGDDRPGRALTLLFRLAYYGVSRLVAAAFFGIFALDLTVEVAMNDNFDD